MTGVGDSPTGVSADRSPRIIERAEQPYAAVRCVVAMGSIATLPARLPELFEWLGRHEASPAGAVFFRYELIDMAGDLVVEVGVPVSGDVPGAGDIVTGVLPAGRYVSAVHVGHPDQLMDATARLLAWGEDAGVTWDATDTPAGTRWGCRLEIYLTDPNQQPDMDQWLTQMAFRLR